MDYTIKGNDILLKQDDFELSETLDCGQAFRWETVDGGYTGFFLNTPLTIKKTKDIITLHDTSESVFLNTWYDYFDLGTDYGELKRRFSEDETLAKACEFAPGIRLLKQDKWEAICSFILSQNNNIPRIKGIIKRLCDTNGGFPSPEKLYAQGVEGLAYLRSGFRAKYIYDACEKIVTSELVLDDIAKMPIDEARNSLMKIKGVGPKVAECALLFGFYKIEAFPIDVWIKRVLEQYYPNGLPACIKGFEGIAQQYLFHYIRNLEQK